MYVMCKMCINNINYIRAFKTELREFNLMTVEEEFNLLKTHFKEELLVIRFYHLIWKKIHKKFSFETVFTPTLCMCLRLYTYIGEMTFYGNGFIHIMARMTIINTLRHICHILGLEGNSWHKLALLMLTLIDKHWSYYTDEQPNTKEILHDIHI